MSDPILSCQNVSKSYNDGQLSVDVLRDVNFSVMAGELIAIVGPSGAGKSTLLHILGGLDTVNQGAVNIMGEDLSSMSEKKRCRIRNQHLGFVYQFHHLLPEFSALENIAMPLLIAGHSPRKAKQQALQMLDRVDLKGRAVHKPAQLSGGERQRVAIARGLVSTPKCLLADEPTGNLDQKTASHVYDIMLNLNKSMKTSLLIVTHDIPLANKMDRVLTLENGALIEK